MTTTYAIYSCRVTIEAWPELAAAIHARLEGFTAARPTSSNMTISFTEEQGTAPRQPTGDGRRVYEFPGGHVAYHDDGDVLGVVVGDRIRGVCYAAEGVANIGVDAPATADTWVLSHPVLSLVLMEMLKRQGFFPVHAAGVAVDGDGVLLAGTSGAGKSTLAVALARRGCSFLSDDTLFLEATASGWRMCAFPDQIDLCADAPAFFPELQAVAGMGRTDWPKFQCRAEDVYQSIIPAAVSPRVVMFPTVRHEPATIVRPMSGAAALLALAPNVLLTHAPTSQRHFDALAGLVAQCTCYHLETGENLDDAVRVIRGAVAA